jgi:2-polyprenyl-6-methoxyphenol hydroxylase-like FAD-dependent oxidoreductase
MSAIASALVVGGGIGGLTAAIALVQRGVKVELIEARPDLSVYGVGIIQPNNTLRALAKIGLARACVDAGAPFPGWRVHDAAGNVMMDLPGANTAAPDCPAVNGITRPTLHKILTDAAVCQGAVIRLGDKIDTFEDNRKTVSVRFSSGKSGQYDLVVGCDGLYSDLRKRLFGNSHEPQFTGQGVWRYNLRRPADMEWGAVFFGRTTKVGLVPMTANLMYMLIVTAEPGNPRFERDVMAQTMRGRLAGHSGLVAELRPLITDTEGVVYRPMETMLLPSPWMKGRVILIGDAAHATTPHLSQGAAMAIEDAVLLGELMGRDAPLPALLDEFMRRRFDRTKLVVNNSLQLGEWEMEEWKTGCDHSAELGGLVNSTNLALLEDY